METPKIFESEYRFCLILWEHGPISAAALAKICAEQLGWKRTTTYTVIKRLGERGGAALGPCGVAAAGTFFYRKLLQPDSRH